MTQPPPHTAAPYASLTARYLTPALALLRALGAAVGAVAAALLLVAVLVAAQGRAVETRHADAILVVGARCVAAAPDLCPALGHALDLLRRGYATRLLVATDDAEPARTNLLTAGLPAEALLAPAAGANKAQRIRAAAGLLRADGMASVLLVGQPSDMLLALKMTRDQGLTAYATPLAAEGPIPPLGALLAEAGAYWRYVLLGE